MQVPIVEFSTSATAPLNFKLNFPIAWTAIRAAGLPVSGLLPERWSDGTTGAWFSTSDPATAKGLLLAVRCLIAEWIVYQCEQHLHPDARTLIRLQTRQTPQRTRNLLADALDRILGIDFESVLGGSSTSADVRNIDDDAALKAIERIVEQLQGLELNQLRDLVGNSGLPDLLFELIQDRLQRARRGTVQTDPELAQIVAALGLDGRPKLQRIIDPCAGIGNLLVAAFLRMRNAAPGALLSRISAIEIDPIQASLAALQLTMQIPAEASPDNQPNVVSDTVINHPEMIGESDIVLLNPPYKRYEADGDPLPPEFRENFELAIETLKGGAASTTGGQADLYNFFVEFVILAMSEGARGVFILNNKWMNTKSSRSLRKFLVEQCAIESLIQYPRGEFFEDHLISTSLLVITKGSTEPNYPCRFVRCLEDLRLLGSQRLSAAALAGEASDKIQVATHTQADILAHTSSDTLGSWRNFFPVPDSLTVLASLPLLVDLFDSVVQGRLERDEISKIFSFPFRDWRKKGTGGHDKPSRRITSASDRAAPSGPEIPFSILDEITAAAAAIPKEYRGYAIKVAHRMGQDLGFTLAPENLSHEYEDGSTDAILEPPDLRSGAWTRGPNKSSWGKLFDDSLSAMRSHPVVGKYIRLVETELGASTRPSRIIWEDLLRPCAGELILLRSFRVGWRAHFNPFALDPSGRQLRISSNFYSLRGPAFTNNAPTTDEKTRLIKVILAFLISSFGQIQFEFYGQNREGLRKCEKSTCIDKIRVLNPISIAPEWRHRMATLVDQIECPINCESHPHADANRRKLDLTVATCLLERDDEDFSVFELANSTAHQLDELQRERLG